LSENGAAALGVVGAESTAGDSGANADTRDPRGVVLTLTGLAGAGLTANVRVGVDAAAIAADAADAAAATPAAAAATGADTVRRAGGVAGTAAWVGEGGAAAASAWAGEWPSTADMAAVRRLASSLTRSATCGATPAARSVERTTATNQKNEPNTYARQRTGRTVIADIGKRGGGGAEDVGLGRVLERLGQRLHAASTHKVGG
jgi:hypothetical protein